MLSLSLFDNADVREDFFVGEAVLLGKNDDWFFPGGEIGGVPRGLIGLEKLTDPLFNSCSLSVKLPRLVFLARACLLGLPVMTPGPLSRLTPRPPVSLGGGDKTRSGGSTLAGRLCDFTGTGGGDAYSFGIGGIGGGSSALILAEEPRFGDGSRKVLSVIEPELFCRCRPGFCGLLATLPCDDVEVRRWIIRFVCISPTGVGVVVWERRAAAAAALERLALEARLARKACAAAVAAAAVGGVFTG